jgi:dTDP-4-dehydrorhamnose 3,5-epimerase-like enzyme
MEATVIEGNVFTDQRGSVSFVNDFKFLGIERFYIIENSEMHPLRVWQGHKLDSKNFYCIKGSFKISFVKVDNWENPSSDLKVESMVLTAGVSAVLNIPFGYANAIKSLEKGSRLLSFSTLPLDQVSNDDVRFDVNTRLIGG